MTLIYNVFISIFNCDLIFEIHRVKKYWTGSKIPYINFKNWLINKFIKFDNLYSILVKLMSFPKNK